MVDLRKNYPFDPKAKREVSEELFAEIGCRLVLLQDLEMFIAFVAKVVFAEDSETALNEILNADTKTLGQLINQLRKCVTLSASFEECLKRTLKARNLFVHEFSHEFDIRTQGGMQKGFQFLVDTMDDLVEVSNVMRAALVSYANDIGVAEDDLEKHWRHHGDLEKLEKQYVPKVSAILRTKS